MSSYHVFANGYLAPNSFTDVPNHEFTADFVTTGRDPRHVLICITCGDHVNTVYVRPSLARDIAAQLIALADEIDREDRP